MKVVVAVAVEEVAERVHIHIAAAVAAVVADHIGPSMGLNQRRAGYSEVVVERYRRLNSQLDAPYSRCTVSFAGHQS